MIRATPEAIEAIRLFLEKNGLQKPVRVHLRSTGCCDASLGLMVDDAHDDDWTEDIQGVVFLIGRDLERLTGDIGIDYLAEPHRTGFVLTSENPVSEWNGFGVCEIKV
jgi:Fe-S cluster assembly iron-binding protein IscA